MRINVQIALAVIEKHRVQQSHEAEIVIAMEMTDKDMTDAMRADARLR